ncbi:unnamed protein product [Blumeria hordei]|uniref:Uncharacterized protein n=1 Tax=Blumeria hordei TaxID=2867405 RepID=A0A383URC6_BLUHO|nr:unnamed protein product [Blumeria hordei]
MANGEFKGIININNRKEKCVPLWDISSVMSDNIYIPSSTLNLQKIKDSYWPESCFGHKIKSATIWLYLELALKDWVQAFNGRKPNFPIIKNRLIQLWPIRTPESHDNSFKYVFAIGYHTELDTYSLYYAKVMENIFENFLPCFNFSPDIIRKLQKNFAELHSHGESSFLVH